MQMIYTTVGIFCVAAMALFTLGWALTKLLELWQKYRFDERINTLESHFAEADRWCADEEKVVETIRFVTRTMRAVQDPEEWPLPDISMFRSKIRDIDEKRNP